MGDMMSGTVYENGVFLTLDDTVPQAPALALRGERIVAVGGIAECRDAAGPGSERVNLEGRTVVPGLTDSHIHAAQLGLSYASVDLSDTTDLQGALLKLGRHVSGSASTGWVLGGRWDANKWTTQKMPTRSDLDTIVKDRPAALSSTDGHSLWVNTIGLTALGIDLRTPDPPGGRIMRDSEGMPTGILLEAAIPTARLAAEATNDLIGSITRVQQHLLSVGVTSIHEIDGRDVLKAFQTLRVRGQLGVRVHKMIPQAHLAESIADGHATGDGDSWIRTGPVKLFTDGSLGSHTCSMGQEFEGEPGNYGISRIGLRELTTLIKTASAAGIAVAAHAIGDEANHQFLRAITAARGSGEGSRLRHRSEHAQFLRHSDLAVMAKLNVTASMQPTHCTSDLPLIDTLLSETNLASYAWRSLRHAGVNVAFGSDAPVEDPNPWHGIHAAVTRQRQDDFPAGGWQPEERLSLISALRSYTIGPAYASYEEHLKGSLRPGMLGDFIVLETDPRTESGVPLYATQVVSTVVGGRVQWSR